MKGKRRLSPQQIQENISRNGFAELLERHEWVTGDVSPDLGEDFLVRIYDNGVSTGITFYIQLKSTGNIEKLRLKSGEISYPFEVPDLEHWDAQGVPVLLVIWDISISYGCYIWVSEAVRFLNSKNGNWRSRKKVKVHFPGINYFTDSSFPKLRQDLAIHYYPIISKGKNIEINAAFEFPPTSEGKTKLAEFEKYLAKGDEVEISGDFIKKFVLPDWWTRLFGEVDPRSMNLKIGPFKNSPIKPFQFDFFSPKFGTKRLQQIELRLEKQGEEEITLTNSHQKIPIKFSLVINRKTNQFGLTIKLYFGSIDGYLARDAIQIQQILSEESRIRIKNLETGQESLYPVSEGQFPAPDAKLIDFLNKICFIQDETGVLLTFPEDSSFDISDVKAVDELVSILGQGIFKQTEMKFSAEILKPGIELMVSSLEEKKPLSFRITTDGSFVEILGQKVETGPMTQYVKGYWDAKYEEVMHWIGNSTDEDSFKLVLSNTEIMQEFANWPRKQLEAS